MALRIHDIAPDFTADSTAGQIRFHRWIGDSYAILMSHPRDFTPVCTTEFTAVARIASEFERRNTKVIGVSADSVDEHMKWKTDIETLAGRPADFPIIDDRSLAVARAYDMLPADAPDVGLRTPAALASVRTLYIIGPDKRIRLVIAYPMSVGRNFSEVLRALDAVQATDAAPVTTPADWMPGQDVIVALTLNDAAAREKFGQIDAPLPYLRFVKAPA